MKSFQSETLTVKTPSGEIRFVGGDVRVCEVYVDIAHRRERYVRMHPVVMFHITGKWQPDLPRTSEPLTVWSGSVEIAGERWAEGLLGIKFYRDGVDVALYPGLTTRST